MVSIEVLLGSVVDTNLDLGYLGDHRHDATSRGTSRRADATLLGVIFSESMS